MGVEELSPEHQILNMPLFAWRLLGQYLAVVNYDCIERGVDKLSYTNLASYIITKFAIDHAPDIQRAFDEIRLDVAKGDIVGYYTAAQLAAIPSASRSDIPAVFRIGASAREAEAKRGIIRTVPKLAQRPERTAQRPPGRSRKVRGGRKPAAAGPGVRKKKPRAAKQG